MDENDLRPLDDHDDDVPPPKANQDNTAPAEPADAAEAPAPEPAEPAHEPQASEPAQPAPPQAPAAGPGAQEAKAKLPAQSPREKLLDAMAATRDELDVPSREAELEVYKQALMEEAREHFLPITKPAVIDGICKLDGLSKEEQKKLCHISHMLEALYHFEYHKDLEEIKDEYIPLSPESPEDEQYTYPEDHDRESGMPADLRVRVESLTGRIRNLLEKSNFTPISKEDMDFAMHESHVFDLPVEIDWDRFDGEPLIYARGRDRDIVEGKFTARKLPGYLVRGSLGNVVIGLVLIALAAMVHFLYVGDGGARSIVIDPQTAGANSLRPEGTAIISIDNAKTVEDRKLKFYMEYLDEDQNYILVENGGIGGTIIDQKVEDGNVKEIVYQAPRADQMFADEQHIVAHWELIERASGDVVRSGKQALTLIRPSAAESAVGTFNLASYILLVLGGIGVLIGLFNFVRRRRMDAEERRLKLIGDTEGLRQMTIERNRALRVDEFRDLFRIEAIPGDMFRQVVIMFKLKGESQVLLKLFKDIPLADLELIFPNTKPRMKIKDRVLLLVSGTAAIGMLLGKLVSIFLAAVFTFGIGAIIGIATAGGAAARAWSKFKNTVNRYNQVLTESLYYKNLDNNFGVVHFLLDNVEEQELKEALLGYAFLYQAQGPLTEEQLDQAIEAWIKREFGLDVDFEVGDAIEKMERYGILLEDGTNDAGETLYNVPDLDTALHRLDSIWDGLFEFRDENAEDDEAFAAKQTSIMERNTRNIGPANA